jgi:hypothetical protein
MCIWKFFRNPVTIVIKVEYTLEERLVYYVASTFMRVDWKNIDFTKYLVLLLE